MDYYLVNLKLKNFFSSSINQENKLKEKFSPIDLQIYEELRDSNVLQQCSMEIDNTSIVWFLLFNN